jgi:heme-degrading monooxygenase HmoA
MRRVTGRCGRAARRSSSKRWEEFLTWSRETVPGLHRAHLLRDAQDPGRFLSYSRWQDDAARDAWRSHPGFAERFRACRALCDDFSSGDYTLTSNI